MRGAHGADPDDPVVRAVVARIDEYCDGVDPVHPLHVVVEAATRVEAERRTRIRLAAEQAGAEAAGHPVIVKLRVLQRTALAPREINVDVTMPPPPKPPPAPTPATEANTPPRSQPSGRSGTRPADKPPTKQYARTKVAGPDHRWSLRVVYLPEIKIADGPQFVFSVAPDEGWIPFGRGLGLVGRERGLEFGPMRAIPSGCLLEVACGDQGLLVRRLAERPGYSVSVNGRSLTVGTAAPGAWEGTVVYTRPPALDRTILQFQLTREGAA